MHPNKHHVKPKQIGRPRQESITQLLSQIITGANQNKAQPFMIAIGGPGGTGKSSLAKGLAKQLDQAAVLHLDDYKTSRASRLEANVVGPHPYANKMDLIHEHLKKIKQGEDINHPVYDSELGDSLKTALFRPRPFTIIEGEVSTYGEFHNLIDFSIFIDAHWRTQLATRLSRDRQVRGHSLEKAVSTFLNSNLREFVEHGAASKKWCDIHLFCHDDYQLELEAISEPIYQVNQDLILKEMEELDLSGTLVPVVTPFLASGEINQQGFVNHIDMLANQGVKRLLVGDLIGEFLTMTSQERLNLLQLALEYFPGMVCFNIASHTIEESAYLAKSAVEMGADAIFYQLNGPNKGQAQSEGMALIKKSISCPFVIYDDHYNFLTSATPNHFDINYLLNIHPENEEIEKKALLDKIIQIKTILSNTNSHYFPYSRWTR